MPDIIKISELDEALALADAAEFPYYQDNGGQNTTYKAPMTQIGAKIVEGLTFQGINLPAGAGNKTVENSLNFLIDSVGGDPNGNISDSYDPTTAYVKGDLCIYENVLYICTDDNITGTFDPSKWTATTIDNVVGSLSTLTTTNQDSLVDAVNEVNTNAVKSTSAKPLFKSLRTNAIAVTISANAYATITANDVIGAITGGIPSGYTVIAITRFYQTDDSCYLLGYDPTATGTSAFAFIKNPTASAKSRSVIFDLLCVNSDYI